jgi:4-hydroxy-tetrahydrodipicolinate synthase
MATIPSKSPAKKEKNRARDARRGPRRFQTGDSKGPASQCEGADASQLAKRFPEPHNTGMTRPLDLNRLATVQVVPPTPFDAAGREVLPDRLSRLVSELRAAGVSVFIPAAGTGEFHSLAASEAIACVRATRAAAPDAVVIAPVGLGLAHALEVGAGAIDAGADALLVMPPVHPYLCDAGCRDYFQALFDALPLPFLAYKRGPAPSDHLLAELGAAGERASRGRLVGVKYAVNDLDAFARFAARRGTLRLYCGTAERYAPFFSLAGAEGYTSGLGCVFPRTTLALQGALRRGDLPAAMQLLAALRPIEDYRARDGDSYNISAIKFALSANGHDFGPPRPPQRRLTEAEQAELRTLLAPLQAREQAAALGESPA